MKDEDKNREQLINELKEMRQLMEANKKHTQISEALQENEKFLNDVFESIQDGISVLDTDLTVCQVNNAMKKWYAQNLPLEGKKCYEVYHNRDVPCDPCPTLRCLESGKTEREIVPGIPGSSAEWIELFSYPIKDRDSGEVIGVVEFVRDITELTRSEKKIRHLNTVLRTVRNINQLIAREKDRDRLIQGACNCLIETQGYRNAWISLLDESGKFTTAAEAGCSDNFLPMLEKLKSGDLPICAQKALGQSRPVIIEDPFSHCTDCPLSPNCVNRSNMSIRLEYSGKIYGLLCVSVLPSLDYDEQEQMLFKEVAGDLAFALHDIELEEEHKQVIDALKISEAKFRELFNSMSSGVAVCETRDDGQDFVFTDVNHAVEQIEEVKKEDLIGKSIVEMFPSVKYYGLFDVLQRVWKTGKPEHHSISMYKDNKITGWRENNVYKLPTGEVVIVYDDVTERKQAEKALQYKVKFENIIATISTNFINLALDKIDTAIDHALQKLGEFVNADRSYVFLFSDGSTKMDNTNKWCAEGIEPQIDNLQNLSSDIVPWWMERLNRFETIHIPRVADLPPEASAEKEMLEAQDIQSLVVVPIAYGGELIGFAGFDSVREERTWPEEDIRLFRIATEIFANALRYSRNNEKLRASEERYRQLVENANEAILVVQDEMIKFLNPKLTEIFGYSEEEVATKPFVEFIHPDDRDIVLGRYMKRINGEKVPPNYTFRGIDKDGNIKWLEINAIAITWEGKPATLSFLTDITERKKMEEELQKIEKLESVGVLAGGIAHDFNNLMTGVLGNISLAKMYSHEKDVIERLAEAEEATLRSKNLTHQLLTFSKGGEPIKETASISELLKDTTRFALRGSNVRCTFLIPDDLWTVEIDKGQISQVIQNLVINADHAMPEGGVLKIKAENTVISDKDNLPLKEGKYIKISVEDEGIGIPERILSKIFDPYFTTKDRGAKKGTGLGLAISYSIIEKHDGYITVYSEVGTGTTFHIYLPASQKEITGEERVEEEDLLAKGKILVMDDEKMVRDVADAILQHLGYDVELTEDGAKAIELYQKAQKSGEPFDAVILDLTVRGGMGGREAIMKLIEIDPEVKAIVSSGFATDPVMSNFDQYGFSGVVAKPFDIKELGETLRKVIKKLAHV